MKKGDITPKRICVQYRGGELILDPGHSTYELDLKTGLVTHFKPKLKLTTVLNKKKKYYIDDHPDKLYLPAFDLQKAFIKFKHLARALNINVKIST